MEGKTFGSLPLLFVFDQSGTLLPKLPLFQYSSTSNKACIRQRQKMSEGTLKLSFWPLDGISSPDLADSLCSGKNDDYTRTPNHQATSIVALEYDTTR